MAELLTVLYNVLCGDGDQLEDEPHNVSREIAPVVQAIIDKRLEEALEMDPHALALASSRVRSFIGEDVSVWTRAGQCYKGELHASSRPEPSGSLLVDQATLNGTQAWTFASSVSVPWGEVLAVSLCGKKEAKLPPGENTTGDESKAISSGHPSPRTGSKATSGKGLDGAAQTMQRSRHIQDPDPFFDQRHPPERGRLQDLISGLAKRMAPRLDSMLQRRQRCRVLVCECDGAHHGPEALMIGMSALDVFFAERPALDELATRRLITLDAWTVDFSGENAGNNWPEELTQPAGSSFVDDYSTQSGVQVRLRSYGAHHPSTTHFGFQRCGFESDVRGDAQDSEVAAAIVVQVGADLVLDLRAPFLVGGMESMLAFLGLHHGLPEEAPILYAQLEVQEGFSFWPQHMQCTELFGMEFPHTVWNSSDVPKQRLQLFIRNARAKAISQGKRLDAYLHDHMRTQRHFGFIIHCIEKGWTRAVQHLACGLKLHVCEFVGDLPALPKSCAWGTLHRRHSPHLDTWRELQNAVEELGHETASYGALLAAFVLVRGQAVPAPPQCPGIEPSDTCFAKLLLHHVSLAWTAYRRVRISQQQVIPTLSSKNQLIEMFDAVANEAFVSKRKAIYSHFLSRRGLGALDVFMWLLKSAGTGEGVVRTLLPWAGIASAGPEAEAALRSIVIDDARHTDSLPGGPLPRRCAREFGEDKEFVHKDELTSYRALAHALEAEKQAVGLSSIMHADAAAATLQAVRASREASASKTSAIEVPRGQSSYVTPYDTGGTFEDVDGSQDNLDKMAKHLRLMMADLVAGSGVTEAQAPVDGSSLNAKLERLLAASQQTSVFEDQGPGYQSHELTADNIDDVIQRAQAQVDLQEQSHGRDRVLGASDSQSTGSGMQPRHDAMLDEMLLVALPKLSLALTNPKNLPDGWEEGWSDEHKRCYYFNRETGERTWRRPRRASADSDAGSLRRGSPASNITSPRRGAPAPSDVTSPRR